MNFGKSKGNDEFLEINFTLEINDSPLKNSNHHSFKRPRRSPYLDRKYDKRLSFEKKIGEIEGSRGKELDEGKYEMRVRARNLEKRMKIVKKRREMSERRTLKLKENRHIGCGKKVRITIERGEPINITFCKSSSSDGDFSVSPCAFKNERLVRSGSADFCQISSKDDSMVKSQNFGVAKIVEGINGLKILGRREEEINKNDK